MPRKPPSTASKTVAKKPATKPIYKKAPAAKQAKAADKRKPAKAKGKSKGDKTVRDSFNMPAADYALIGELKKRALTSAREIKKSELLRAGLKLLASLRDEAFNAALAAVPAIKTGRPKKK